MFASAPREGGSGMAIARQRVAYPGGETSLTGPEDRIWPDDSWKKIFPWGPLPTALTVLYSVYIRESLGQHLYAG